MRCLRAATVLVNLISSGISSKRSARSVRIQCIGEKHERLTIQCACGGHSVRRIGEQNGMRFLGNGASRSMAAEIDDLNIMFAASCLDGGNVFVSPAPKFDMSKPRGGDARNFLFRQEIGIQGLEANGGVVI